MIAGQSLPVPEKDGKDNIYVCTTDSLDMSRAHYVFDYVNMVNKKEA
jgi:hypothetical protein